MGHVIKVPADVITRRKFDPKSVEDDNVLEEHMKGGPMKTWFVIIIVGVFLLPFQLMGQDTTDFFSHHLGDLWEYYLLGWELFDTTQVRIIFDSTDVEGNDYIIQESKWINPDQNFTYNYYKIDALGQVFTGFTSEGWLIYRLNAKVGEIWQVGEYTPWAIVDSIWQENIFGILTTFKNINYYSWIDTTDTTFGLWLYIDCIAGGFGLVDRTWIEPGYDLFLKGAIIDSVVYGDVTIMGMDEATSPVIPDRVFLYHNYPNPFNPHTTISFELKKTGQVSLIVYDIIGREVIRLIDDEVITGGKHQVMWNGTNEKGGEVSSGLYLYRLNVGDQVTTRRMMLIR